jgi:hypothetical protein
MKLHPEDAFCSGCTKYFEKVQNHSKTTFFVMICCSVAGGNVATNDRLQEWNWQHN